LPGISSENGNGRRVFRDRPSPPGISKANQSRVDLEPSSSARNPTLSSTGKIRSRLPIISGFSKESGQGMETSRKGLRRKAPSIEQYVSKLGQSGGPPIQDDNLSDARLAKRSSKSLPDDFRETRADPFVGAAVPEPILPMMQPKTKLQELPPALIPELKALAAASATSPTAASTPHVPTISSPSSTQYSGSTGFWSSRNTTPTSVSSCSPGIVQPLRTKAASRARVPVPDLLPRSGNISTDIQELPILQEGSGALVQRNASSRSAKQQELTQEHGKKQKRGSLLRQAPKHLPPRKSSLRSEPPGPAKDTAAKRANEAERRYSTAQVSGSHPPTSVRAQNTKTAGEGSFSGVPPRRPSRKGTADLDLDLSPVVQSNLSSQSLRGYRRRESRDYGPVESTSQENNARRHQDSTPPDPSARREGLPELRSPDVTRASISGLNRHPVAPTNWQPTTLKPVDKSKSAEGLQETGRSGLGKFSSRLGIFGRRTKISRDETSDGERKDLRKGPAAGTGHEGYGKYGRRGRKYSFGSVSTSRDRSTSTKASVSRPSLGSKGSLSSGGGSDMDDFVAQRLEPVVIPGGGRDGIRPGSDASTVWPSFDRTPLDSTSTLDLSRHITNDTLGSNLSDSRSMSATSVATDAPSSIITHLKSMIPSRPGPSRAPASFDRRSSDGYSTSQSSFLQNEVSAGPNRENPGRSAIRDLRKASKKGRMFKWNPFHRRPSATQMIDEVERQQPEPSRMSVAVAPVTREKTMPYYALVDSENENDASTNTLEDLLDQVYDSASSRNEAPLEPQGLGLRQRCGQSVLLPLMPALQDEDPNVPRSDSPKLFLRREHVPNQSYDDDTSALNHTKLNRLPRIGRIPRVISRRDRQHKPPATSFSRPFQRDTLQQMSQKGGTAVSVATTAAERPILGIQTDVLPSRPFIDTGSGQPASAPAGRQEVQPLGDYEPYPQYLVFHSSGGSGISSTRSTERALSVADIPSLPAPMHHTGEDEVWNEYDDLIDHVMSPSESSPDDPFARAALEHLSQARPDSNLHPATFRKVENKAFPPQPPSLLLPPILPAARLDTDYRLRRSRIVSALQSHSPLSPSSPFSIGDYARDYDDRKRSLTDPRQSYRSEYADYSSLSPAAEMHYQAFPTASETSHHQSSALLDIAERDHQGPAGQSDLRFAALMTSRWLSFGRVLFSPAHEVVEANPEQHVLVIDGLGNDDWSFYLAVTYPRAVVHDLKETDIAHEIRPEPAKQAWRAPANYRRVEIPNLAERFPFPQSYFAAVVLRFPAAMSDTILTMAFAECKRVLVPGGHVEVSLLDLDIVNMGTVTRHAVRELKMRMTAADPEVSLKPIGDNIQKILGLRGFENLNRCVVGVPVTGKVATSSGSRSSRSSRDSYYQKGKEKDLGATASIPQQRMSISSGGDRQRGGNFSLSELVADHSATSDEKITKMVGKVGRWWYTRTYEWAVLPGGDLQKSIWHDKKVLHECRVRGSGFKLLIAYAQKPIEMRRRTMSEPIRPTAAVSGTRTMNRR
jgi:hypothetical protein